MFWRINKIFTGTIAQCGMKIYTLSGEAGALFSECLDNGSATSIFHKIKGGETMNLVAAFILLQGLVYFIVSILGIYLGRTVSVGLMGIGLNLNFIGAALGICMIISSVGLFQKKKYGYNTFRWTYSIFLVFQSGTLINIWFKNGFDLGYSLGSLILLGIFYKILTFVGKERARFI